jgi:hypothetical protein
MKIIQAYKDANKEWIFKKKSDPEESFSFSFL